MSVNSKLDFPQPKIVDAFLDCPRCGMINVLTRAGSTCTLARLNFYKKYTGDCYDHSLHRQGLFNELHTKLWTEFENTVKKSKDAGEIDAKEYKKLYGKCYRLHQKLIAELEVKQKADRAIVVAEEKAIMARLRKEAKV